MNKKSELINLANIRKSKTYSGHTAIGEYNSGIWECDYVSPYSITANSVDASVMIILQDWCSEEGFGDNVCQETLKYGYTPSVKTNINLKELLSTHLLLTLEETYATNLFPYIKPGPMNARIPAKDLLNSAKEFTLPMIEIISPKVAICFGKDTFNALRKACGLKVVYNMDEAVSSNFKHNGTEIFCQSHPGQLGKNNRNRGGVDRVTADWKNMASYI